MTITDEDTARLLEALRVRFPHARLVDRIYSARWRRARLRLAAARGPRLLIDGRAEALLAASATRLPTGQWQVRSNGGACIEWDAPPIG